MDSVMFEGVRIMKGSDGFELYHDKKDTGHKRLKAHMAELDKTWRKLEGRPASGRAITEPEMQEVIALSNKDFDSFSKQLDDAPTISENKPLQTLLASEPRWSK